MAFLLVVLLASSWNRPAPEKPESVGQVVSGPAPARSSARLTVRDAASRIDVRLAELPGRLYRISTPPGSGLAPVVTASAGRVGVRLRATGADGPDRVTIELNRTVRWDVRLPAGAGEQHLDLTGGRVTRVDLGAAGLIALRLPRPRGTVGVTLPGGAGSVSVAGPRSVPVLVRLDAGSGPVRTPWATRSGTTPGTVLAARSWRGSTHRFVLDAGSPLGALTVAP